MLLCIQVSQMIPESEVLLMPEKKKVLNFCMLPSYHISQLYLLLYKHGICVSI